MNKALPLSAALFFLFTISFTNLKANDTLTRAQVYNFNVGDTFDYATESGGINNPIPHTYVYYRVIITGKTLTAGADSLIINKRIYRNNDTSDVTAIFTRLQEYEIQLTQDSLCPLLYSIDSGLSFNGKKKNTVTTTGCLNGGSSYSFAEGLGMVYKHTESNSNPEFDAFYTETLVYYSNGTERWGTPIATGIQQLNYAPDIYSFNISPNPANSVISINVSEKILNSTLTFASISGRLTSTTEINAINTQFSIDFPSGLYFVTLSNGQQSVTRKLVVSK